MSMIAATLVLIRLAFAASQDPDYEGILKAARFTLSESVDLAAKEAKDGTAVTAVLIEGQSGPGVVVFFARSGMTYGYTMNSSTGKRDSACRMFDDRSLLAKAMKISLKDAVAAALKQEKGR